MTASIYVDNVSKSYRLYRSPLEMAKDRLGLYTLRFWRPVPAFATKQALSDISFKLEKGQRTGIVGRNGAGKTTLLKLLNGHVRPDKGSIKIAGKVQALMGLGFGFHPDLSGRENIRNNLVYNGLSGKIFRKAFDDIIDFVELGDFMDQPVRSYSAGMAARVQFAVATAIEPDIVIIDEVMGAGDGYFAAKSAERMRKLTKSGCTLVLVSHSAAQILEFCNHAVWLDQGRMLVQGDVEDVMESYQAHIAKSVKTLGGPTKPNAENIFSSEAPAYMYGAHTVSCIQRFTAPDLCWTNDKSGPLPYTAHHADFEAVHLAVFSPSTAASVTNKAMTGDAVSLEIRYSGVPVNLAGLMCRLLVFSDNGDLVAESLSPPLRAASLDTGIRVELTPLILGHRNYLFGLSLELNNKPVHAAAGFYFKVLETNDSDPPLLHYPAKWYQNNASEPIPSLISGTQ